VLIQGEVTAAAAGDVEAAGIACDAVGKLLALIPRGEASIDAARAAHRAVGKLVAAMTAGSATKATRPEHPRGSERSRRSKDKQR
jgi:hypothetical protein